MIDGGVNRTGDLLILDYAEEWFDAIVIGNHELPFFGGPGFMGLRQYDRELRLRLLELENKGIYVPSAVVDGFLLVHAGLADRWSFQSAEDANDVIRQQWRDAEDMTKEVPMFDWIGPGRGGKYADTCGGIFWCDWSESRNKKVNQVVGHSTLVKGPVLIEYQNSYHWNIDVGGKYGTCLGGITIEDGDLVTPFFWGERVQLRYEAFDYGDRSLGDMIIEEPDEDEMGNEVSFADSRDDDETSMWRELMETV